MIPMVEQVMQHPRLGQKLQFTDSTVDSFNDCLCFQKVKQRMERNFKDEQDHAQIR